MSSDPLSPEEIASAALAMAEALVFEFRRLHGDAAALELLDEAKDGALGYCGEGAGQVVQNIIDLMQAHIRLARQRAPANDA
jgi:hypothetical protein